MPGGDAGQLGDRFLRLWSAATVSAAGDGLRQTALPLLAAAATRDPRAVALVTAAGFAPWPLLGLLGGAIADRVDRRSAMWVIDAGRGALMAGFAVLVGTLGVPVAALAGLAFLLGAAETVFDNAATALLPSLVAPTWLPAANSRLMTSQTLAGELVGPPLAGLLFGISASVPLALDAVSFLVAALLVATLGGCHLNSPAEATPVISRWSGLGTGIRQGLGWLWHEPVLRTLTVVIAVLGAVSGALLALLVLYVQQVLGLGSAGYGTLFSCYALGGVAGALGSPWLLRHRPSGHLLLAAVITAGVAFTGLGVTSRPVVAGVALGVFGVSVGLWNVTVTTLRQTLVPDGLLGRVSSAYRTIALTFTTAGAGVAGLTANSIGIPATLIGCAALVGVLTATLGHRLAAATTIAG